LAFIHRDKDIREGKKHKGILRRFHFVKFHAKQSLTIFIAEVFFALSKPILSFLPNYGTFADIMGALLFISRIMGLIYGITGQVKKIPIIGDLSEKLPL